MKYYLGMDVGGTKTYCIVLDETGGVRGFGRAGTGSYEYHGVEAAALENRKAVDETLADARLELRDIAAVGLGVAGADLPEDFAMLEEAIYMPLFGALPRVFRNDSFAALRGGARAAHGVVIVCGTGSVCAGRSPEGRETRVGGLGPDFGDQCTGVTLGDEALRVIWRARDGIVPPTRMTDLFLERSGCADVEEFFSRTYRGKIDRAALEPAAQLVFRAAVDGDPQACDILVAGGRYLGAMVNAVARNLALTGAEFEVVTAGGVFRGESPVLRDEMESVIQVVCPLAKLTWPLHQPVVGAALMGMERDSDFDSEFWEGLDAALREASERYGIVF